MDTEHIETGNELQTEIEPGKTLLQKSIDEPLQRDRERKITQKLRWNWFDTLYLLLLALLVVGMAWRYAPNLTGAVPGHWWDPLFSIWALSWDTNTLLHNPTHLWQAQLLYPNSLSLSYSENLLGEAIFYAPLFLITHNPVLSYNLVFYLTFLLCGVNMYIVARHYTGRRFAAFIAALIFAFAPYRLAQIDHIHIIAGEWIPLTFLYLDKSLQQHRWRHWILFALFYSLQLLSSVYYGIFLAYTLLAYLLIRYGRPFVAQLRRHQSEYIRYLVKQSIRPIVVFGTTLIFLVILMEPYLVSLSNGFSRSVIQAAGYSAFIRDFYFTVPFNMLHGISMYNGETIPLDSEHFLFLGWTIMVIAAIGVVLAFRQRNITMRHFAWTGLIVLLFAFGPYLEYSTPNGAPLLPVVGISHPFAPAIPMPWLIAYHVLPGFQGLRVPSRLIGILLMMLALMGAYVVAYLQDMLQVSLKVQQQKDAMQHERTRGSVRSSRLFSFKTIAISCVFVLLPLALLAEALPSYLPITHVPTGNAIPAVYQWLATHGDSQPLIELPIGQDGRFSAEDEAWYDYYAIYHTHPIANGWSGYRPPLTTIISNLMQHFPSQASIDILEKYHIAYVVFHPQLFLQYVHLSPGKVDAMIVEMQASPHLRLIGVFGGDVDSGDSVWLVG
ncbi:MAG TPA: glycosyltransferase family 39 protein [Ktedonobacteraceae bacterium]